jgi:hypothetical protein
MTTPVIRNQVIGVLRKAAGSYTTDEPTKVPGIKGKQHSADLKPMAAGEKTSPGPTSTNKQASGAGCGGGGGMKTVRRVSGRGRVKKAFNIKSFLGGLGSGGAAAGASAARAGANRLMGGGNKPSPAPAPQPTPAAQRRPAAPTQPTQTPTQTPGQPPIEMPPATPAQPPQVQGNPLAPTPMSAQPPQPPIPDVQLQDFAEPMTNMGLEGSIPPRDQLMQQTQGPGMFVGRSRFRPDAARERDIRANLANTDPNLVRQRVQGAIRPGQGSFYKQFSAVAFGAAMGEKVAFDIKSLMKSIGGPSGAAGTVQNMALRGMRAGAGMGRSTPRTVQTTNLPEQWAAQQRAEDAKAQRMIQERSGQANGGGMGATAPPMGGGTPAGGAGDPVPNSPYRQPYEQRAPTPAPNQIQNTPAAPPSGGQQPTRLPTTGALYGGWESARPMGRVHTMNPPRPTRPAPTPQPSPAPQQQRATGPRPGQMSLEQRAATRAPRAGTGPAPPRVAPRTTLRNNQAGHMQGGYTGSPTTQYHPGAVPGQMRKASSFAVKLAMMKVGPASMTMKLKGQREKDKAQQKLRQTL